MIGWFGQGLVGAAAGGAMAMVCLALVLTLYRLIRGPSTPDRVVALDLLALQAVGVIAIQGLMAPDMTVLAAVLVIGLLAFLGTVAFARYLERKAGP